jgi:hypothetical protein
MRLVGFQARRCGRGAASGVPRTAGPSGADAQANNMVKLNLRDLAAWFNDPVRALARAGVFRAVLESL